MNLRRALLAQAVAVMVAGVAPAVAFSASVSLCVAGAAGQAVVSGACSGAGTTVALPASSADQHTLLQILPHITFVAKGVGGKPTVRFTGVNVQLVNGAGATESVNGTGNLVIGYDENPSNAAQTGSHDLVLGRNQSFNGYAELIAGFQNTALDNYTTALGTNNTAAGPYATVTGGENNAASGTATTVAGGYGNGAGTDHSTIVGGCSNLTGPGNANGDITCLNSSAHPGGFATISGGDQNQASGIDSSVTGGDINLDGCGT
jgi:hypothetical protein